MPSETFYCPQCRRQLTKSAQAYVLGEMMGNKKASFIQLGGLAETVTCPGCGAAIDARKMIAGEYDGTAGSEAGCLGLVLGLGVFGVLVFGYLNPWWVGVIGAVVVGGLAEMIAARRRGAAKS